MFFQLHAGAHIQAALLSQTRFEQLATATGDHQTLEVIQRSNDPTIQRSNDPTIQLCQLHPQRFQEISALIKAQLMGGGQDDLVELAALERCHTTSCMEQSVVNSARGSSIHK